MLMYLHYVCGRYLPTLLCEIHTEHGTVIYRLNNSCPNKTFIFTRDTSTFSIRISVIVPHSNISIFILSLVQVLNLIFFSSLSVQEYYKYEEGDIFIERIRMLCSECEDLAYKLVKKCYPLSNQQDRTVLHDVRLILMVRQDNLDTLTTEVILE